METEKLRKHIEEIIKKTFQTIDEVYNGSKEDENPPTTEPSSHLIYPKYSSKKIRVSEQELRCLFIEEFNKDPKGYFYSIETPTNMYYSFSKKRKNVIPQCYKPGGKKGRSGCIDLAIFNNRMNRCAIIEFKKAPCDAHEYAKDFLKLFSENKKEILRFFVCISDGNITPLNDIKNKVEIKETKINDIINDDKKYSFFEYNSYNDTDAKETKKIYSLEFYSHKLDTNGDYKKSTIKFNESINKIVIDGQTYPS